MSRILIFSPYITRTQLHAYEGTIARACQIRGAVVEYLLCDGLLPECDMHWDSFVGHYPRPFDLCQRCQAGAKVNIEELGMPHRWLGEFVSKSEKENAFAWAQRLAPAEFAQATYDGHPLGNWVVSSVVSYFRQSPPDLNDWHAVNVYRGFLLSAAIVTIGLKNYIRQHSIDSALLFNGRQSITRVAFEIFRKASIRVLTHEFPFYQRGHLNLKPDARCWSLEPFADLWRAWGNVPLDRPALESTLRWLINRRYGKQMSWFAFNSPYDHTLSVRKKLGLSDNKRLLALFTSSTDEIWGDPDLQGPYEAQSLWVQDTIKWVWDKSDVQLVIRVHPHLSGNTGLRRADGEFSYYKNLQANLPAHIRVVLPDDSLNSYALTDEADVALTFGSTIGVEMAMLGKPVILGSRGFYENGSQVLTVRSRETLPALLDQSLGPMSAREIRREAFRLAYYYVFRFEMPFPLVTIFDVMDAKLNFSGPEALYLGKDDTLDRTCDYLLTGGPLYLLPTGLDRTRSIAEEDEFFEELDRTPDYLRDRSYERWQPVTRSLSSLRLSARKVLNHLPFGAGNRLRKLGRPFYRPLLK